VCKVLQGQTDLTCTITGTPYYLSPEIFQKKPYSMKSDVWALGCVLYEMVALRVPFEAPDFQSLGVKVTRGSNPEFPKTYSIELRDVLFSMLKRDHRSRPTANEILQISIVHKTISTLEGSENTPRNSNLLSPRRPPPSPRCPVPPRKPPVPKSQRNPLQEIFSRRRKDGKLTPTARSMSPMKRPALVSPIFRRCVSPDHYGQRSRLYGLK
jgi:serine/threonine protein kinase